MTGHTRVLDRAREALARLERAAARVPCLDLVLYRSARREAIRRGTPIPEHAPGVPAADPAEQPPIAAILRGEEWLASGRPGGWSGLLCDLHWELMQGRDPAPGRLRTGRSWVKGPGRRRVWRRFPEPASLPSALSSFDGDLRRSRDPLLAAAEVYARLFLLHPFRDGNGRVIQAALAILLRERGVLSRPCLLLGAPFDRRRFVALTPADVVPSLVNFALSMVERAATSTASVCEEIADRIAADEGRLRRGPARRRLRQLARGALPLPRVGRDALRVLRRARIASVVPGLFGDPIAFHAALARIVAGETGSGMRPCR